MRALKLLTGICMLVCLLVACKTIETNVVKQSTITEKAYNYVDIDPNEIGNNWEQVLAVPVGPGMAELCYRNPDIDSPFSLAIIFIYGNYNLLGYSYIYEGEINVCLFNTETNAYESTYDKSDKDLVLLWENKYATYFGIGAV